MFTLVYLDYDSDDCTIECKLFDDPDDMNKWVQDYYEGSDYEECPPVRVFTGELTPLVTKWAMILEPGEPLPKPEKRLKRVSERR